MHYHEGTENLVTTFGVLFVVALLAYWWLARRNVVKVGYDASHMDLLLPLCVVGGIIGGLLLSFLMPDDRQVAGEVLQVDTRVRLFGLVVSGAAVVYAYSRMTGLSFRKLLDTLALPTLVALSIHRFGCYLAGCCWGDISVVDPWLSSIATTEVGVQVQTLPWLAGEWVKTGVTYDPGTFPFQQQAAIGLISADALQSLPVHPVQLYEVVLLMAFVLIFWRTPLDKYRPGTLALATIFAYAVIRFAVEYLRADGSIVAGIHTATQLQCIALIVLAGAALKLRGRTAAI
jgi:phosphatidylglycerol:prolipoprotein diacylglycerol transferase